MSALAIIGLGLLGIVLLLVVVPFRVEASASVHEASPAAALSVGWAWGLVVLQVTTAGATLRLLGVRLWRFSRRRAKDPKKAASSRSKRRSLLAALRNRRALFGMLLRLGRTLRLRLRVSGFVGTGDPADTALLFAQLRALRALPGVKLDLEPDWLEEELELDAEGSARISVGHLLVVAAALLWARENRLALRAMRTAG